RGLFTDRTIAKGRVIGEYRGPVVDEDRTRTKRRFTQYFFAVCDSRDKRVKFVIDGGNSRRSSFLRYVNAPNNRREANAQFVQRDDSILLFAIKSISANTEILAWYGQDTKRILQQH
ncbi:MAG TPA: SET domain-containing protein-lysine N-methyltransferase, partial [Oculatellaceae cyanobacterium]